MAPNASLDTPDDPGCDTTRWSDEEIEWMKKGLSEVSVNNNKGYSIHRYNSIFFFLNLVRN